MSEFLEEVKRASDILHLAVQDKRNGEISCDIEDYEVYKIEYHFSRGLDRFIEEVDSDNE